MGVAFGLKAPDAFGLNHPSQLVIGYHWLAFLNQVRKYLSPQFTTHVEYKIDHISKTRNDEKKLKNESSSWNV